MSAQAVIHVHAHPDRVLFGSDELPPGPGGYSEAFDFLDGLRLPGEVLDGVYRGDAQRILGPIERTADAA